MVDETIALVLQKFYGLAGMMGMHANVIGDTKKFQVSRGTKTNKLTLVQDIMLL